MVFTADGFRSDGSSQEREGELRLADGFRSLPGYCCSPGYCSFRWRSSPGYCCSSDAKGKSIDRTREKGVKNL